MDDDAIREFLAAQSTGVLGLPTGDVPYLLPLSYGFDEDASLYFTYLLGESSRKRELTGCDAHGGTPGVYAGKDVMPACRWR